MNRDEYVEKLKGQLDQWNAESARWEAKARVAQAEAKAEYDRQIEALNARREEAMYQMKLLQNASADAWKDVMQGAEEAWKRMQDAVTAARSHFGKD